MTRESAVRVVLVYPELLGTYGDGGNAAVCVERLRRRGLAAEPVTVAAGTPVPAGGDVYLLGGGEDEPQLLAAAGLREAPLAEAVRGGAAVFAVCAGFQILGEYFTGTDGRLHPGAALLDCRTTPGPARRVGDLAVAPTGLELPTLLGYENHAGLTDIGTERALGTVLRGTGNGGDSGADGLVAHPGAGLAVGSYLHGPALAQNPALADLLLRHVLGDLAPLPDPELTAAVTALRAARLRQLRLPAGP